MPVPSWRHAARASLVLLATLAVGCAPGSSSGASAPAAAPTAKPAPAAASPAAGGGAAVTIRMLSEGDTRAFDPPTVSVPRGATITFQHVSGSGHTATADPARVSNPALVALPAGAQPWDSGNLSNGATFSVTLTVPGTYRYVCLPHADRGMAGTITVTG